MVMVMAMVMVMVMLIIARYIPASQSSPLTSPAFTASTSSSQSPSPSSSASLKLPQTTVSQLQAPTALHEVSHVTHFVVVIIVVIVILIVLLLCYCYSDYYNQCNNTAILLLYYYYYYYSDYHCDSNVSIKTIIISSTLQPCSATLRIASRTAPAAAVRQTPLLQSVTRNV